MASASTPRELRAVHDLGSFRNNYDAAAAGDQGAFAAGAHRRARADPPFCTVICCHAWGFPVIFKIWY